MAASEAREAAESAQSAAEERAAALERQLEEVTAVTEQQQAGSQEQLVAVKAKLAAAEKRGNDLDASLAAGSASDSAALSAVRCVCFLSFCAVIWIIVRCFLSFYAVLVLKVMQFARSELSERCHAVMKLEAVAICIEIEELCIKNDGFCITDDDLNVNIKELRDATAAREAAGERGNDLARTLDACQAELKTTLEEAISTRIALDGLSGEMEELKTAANSNGVSTEHVAAAEAELDLQNSRADALAVELESARVSLAEAVDCGEEAAGALSALRELSKGRWAVGDACEISLDDGAASGTVQFVGDADIGEAGGTWVGVELAGPAGRNDGSVKGVRYWEGCPAQHGIIVRPDRLLLPALEPVAAVAAAVGAGSATESEAELRAQVESMALDLKRATHSRRQGDIARKQLEASLGEVEGQLTAAQAAVAEATGARVKCDEKVATLGQELARSSEEAKRLQGYFNRRGEKRASMTLEEREVGVLGREALLDEKQTELEGKQIAQATLDQQERGLALREKDLKSLTASLADEAAELENAKAFLEASPAGSSSAAAADEKELRSAAWQQKRTQEMMALKRKNQTLEAGLDKSTKELEVLTAEKATLTKKLDAEVAAGKARNSSAWRLRQENDKLLKQLEASGSGAAVTLADAVGGDALGGGGVGGGGALTAGEVKALHGKITQAQATIRSLEAVNEQSGQGIAALRSELAQAKAAERVASGSAKRTVAELAAVQKQLDELGASGGQGGGGGGTKDYLKRTSPRSPGFSQSPRKTSSTPLKRPKQADKEKPPKKPDTEKFVFEMMNLVFKTMNFALKMMNFKSKVGGWGRCAGR